MKFGLSEEEYKLLDIKCIHPLKALGAKVWIFGSRARGDYKEASDIDVLYEAGPTMGWATLGKIESALDESRLPYKVDLVDFKNLAESYKEGVLIERVEV